MTEPTSPETRRRVSSGLESLASAIRHGRDCPGDRVVHTIHTGEGGLRSRCTGCGAVVERTKNGGLIHG